MFDALEQKWKQTEQVTVFWSFCVRDKFNVLFREMMLEECGLDLVSQPILQGNWKFATAIILCLILVAFSLLNAEVCDFLGLIIDLSPSIRS